MFKWCIPVHWEEFGIVEVEAPTLEEAMKIAEDENNELPLPEGYYIDGSWGLSYDIEEKEIVRELYNDGIED